MTEQSEIIAIFNHEIGGQFFFSFDENPNEGLHGPFPTAEARDEARDDFLSEQFALAVFKELFAA